VPVEEPLVEARCAPAGLEEEFLGLEHVHVSLWFLNKVVAEKPAQLLDECCALFTFTGLAVGARVCRALPPVFYEALPLLLSDFFEEVAESLLFLLAFLVHYALFFLVCSFLRAAQFRVNELGHEDVPCVIQPLGLLCGVGGGAFVWVDGPVSLPPRLADRFGVCSVVPGQAKMD